VLSDRDLKQLQREYQIINPFIEENIGPASIDLMLGNEFAIVRKERVDIIDPEKDQMYMYEIIKANDYFILHPGEFVLGTTVEEIYVPPEYVAQVDGRSSWGRLGIIVHATAGFIDPGFKGKITLEISNINHVPVKLKVGARIAQIYFTKLTSPAINPYHGKYQGQKTVEVSKVFMDFDKK